jgi:hypothetical protein
LHTAKKFYLVSNCKGNNYETSRSLRKKVDINYTLVNITVLSLPEVQTGATRDVLLQCVIHVGPKISWWHWTSREVFVFDEVGLLGYGGPE